MSSYIWIWGFFYFTQCSDPIIPLGNGLGEIIPEQEKAKGEVTARLDDYLP